MHPEREWETKRKEEKRNDTGRRGRCRETRLFHCSSTSKDRKCYQEMTGVFDSPTKKTRRRQTIDHNKKRTEDQRGSLLAQGGMRSKTQKRGEKIEISLEAIHTFRCIFREEVCHWVVRACRNRAQKARWEDRGYECVRCQPSV